VKKNFRNRVLALNFYTKVLILIFILGFFLRIIGGVGSLLFTYDQARDAIYSMGIFSGQLKIVGPASDVPGLFHGPLFYYLIAPAYYLAGGYPNFVYLEMIFINLLSVVPLFILVKKLFNNAQIALLSALLFSISFETVSYARWISNPALAIPAFAIFYLGLWMAINREKYGFIFLSIGCGLAVQSEVFLVYLIPFLILCLLLYKAKVTDRRLIVLSAIIFLLFIFSYILAELKFHFQGLMGLKSFLLSSLTNNSFKTDNFKNYYVSLSNLFSSNLFYGSKIASGIVSLAIFALTAFSVVKDKDRRSLLFLLLIFFSSLSVFLIATFKAQFVTVGATIPFIILTSYATWFVIAKNKILGFLLIFMLVIGNVSAILRFNKTGNKLFQIQDGMIFKDEINLVKKTYQTSKNEQFSINAVTNPLFTPTTWAYLYQIYSNRYHLNKPYYHGDSDPMSTGYSILPRSGEITKTEFTIIEPNLPPYWVQKTIEFDEARKSTGHTVNVGLFTLITREN